MPQGTWEDPYTVGGIFNDPQQTQSLAGNPMFNMGMGLLASSQDRDINPFSAIMSGLNQAGEQGRIQTDRERDEELRKQLVEYFKQMQLGGMVPQPGAPPGMTGPPGRNFSPTGANVGGTPQMGQYGAQTDPMQGIYRAGWDRALRPR